MKNQAAINTSLQAFLHYKPLIILFALIGIGVVVRVVFPPFYNIGQISSEAKFTDTELYYTFVNDPIESQIKFAQKAILVEGRITGLSDNMILMGKGMEVVRIKLNKNWRYSIPDHGYGDQIIVKGICRGIDMTEVLLTHALIVTVRE